MMQRVTRILFYLLILSLPLGLILRIKIATNIYLIPQDIFVFSIFLITTINIIKKRKFEIGNKFVVFQLLFLITGGISLIVNFFIHGDINIFTSFLYLFRYLIYISLINISNLLKKDGSEYKVLITAGLIILILGFLQYFVYNDLKYLYYLGWDNHLYRLFSTFLDPNYAGVFYGLFLLFVVSIVFRVNLNNSYKELIIAFFTLIAVYLTYSRTALITLLAGVVAIAILKRKIRMLLLALITFGILLTIVSDTSIEGLNPFRTASTIERVISIKEASQIFTESPIIGIGFNAYRYAMLRHGFRSPIGASISNADAGTDNSLLFVMATSGIVGLIFFIFSYYFLLRKLFMERLEIGIMPFCIVIAFLSGCLFLNILFYTPILIFIFTIISMRERLFV